MIEKDGMRNSESTDRSVTFGLTSATLVRSASCFFGIHGGHVNVTDGRYVYMRAAADPSNGPLQEFTLMPTHMRSRFTVGELTAWEPAEPFTFTKGVRTMRVD